jgi:hypothetical protein
MRAFGVVNCQLAFCVVSISLVLPCGDFVAKGLLVGDAAVEALRR